MSKYINDFKPIEVNDLKLIYKEIEKAQVEILKASQKSVAKDIINIDI